MRAAVTRILADGGALDNVTLICYTAIHMPPKEKANPATDPFTTSERILQAFRMPRELVTFLKLDAQATGRDLTGYVNRMLDGIRTWFGLPAAAARYLDADREALRMDRFEYLLHSLYMRSQEIIEKGPGFDGPSAVEKRKR